MRILLLPFHLACLLLGTPSPRSAKGTPESNRSHVVSETPGLCPSYTEEEKSLQLVGETCQQLSQDHIQATKLYTKKVKELPYCYIIFPLRPDTYKLTEKQYAAKCYRPISLLRLFCIAFTSELSRVLSV